MPRHAYKRLPVDNDPIYDSFEVAKLINYVMIDGKKNVARKCVYEAIKELAKETPDDPLKLLHKAIGSVQPTVEVRPRRIGGASYLVPVEVRKARKIYLALNWIIDAANARSNKEYRTFTAKLVAEIKDAANGLGAAIAKRQQVEKMAEANKAFSHLKW
ncbi:MAG: 30S ribosomal protein S7 [Patescibacteria group bacterium]|nr:30S ribosomal protein S7 [Patescibacteria group bacterium]